MGSSNSDITSPAQPDWSTWSKEAVRLMQARNDGWMREFNLSRSQYDWNLDTAQILFRSDTADVVADICVVGSVSEAEGTFLWAWANEAIPCQARRGLEKVRAFGESNGLDLLTIPEWGGSRPEGLEMAAVAARVLDAAGVWIDACGDVTLFFALFRFRPRG